MKLAMIIKDINTKLAGEMLSYAELRVFLDSAIDDINAKLNTRFPVFSTLGPTDTDYTAIPDAFHKTADDLMGIRDGIKNAVDKAMQNEKMKTELITNVSHDLKTPLTSIINYVDLLQKCDIPDETAQSYLQVLSEKSDRLKHLIEDLVEASKASSGAITVHTVSVSVHEFINQLTGEHSEGLSEKNLNVIVILFLVHNRSPFE